MRILDASRLLTKTRNFSYLSAVVTSKSSEGPQANMLCKESLNSSKLSCIVGMITVMSFAVCLGLSGIGMDL